MPRKYVKKTGTKRKTYHRRKRNTVSCRNPAPKLLHQPIAPKFFTTFETGITGKLAVGSLATNWFTVSCSPYNSFNTTGQVFDIAVLGGGFGGTLVPSTQSCATLDAVAYTDLAIGLYQNIRVWTAELTVTMTPTASADISTLVVVPIPEIGLRVAEYDTQYLMAQPRAKAITCTGNNNIKQNTIISKVYMPTLIGYNKRQFMDAAPSVVAAQSVIENVAPAYLIAYQTYSNAVTTGVIAFEVKVRYTVELLIPISEYSNT